jgi:DNA/RNA-binding domain of Phe-tRNA-synthetase-like protein
MTLTVTVAEELEKLLVVAVEVESIVVGPASARLRLWSDQLAQEALEAASRPEHERLRNAIRQMLRHGKFKASGRSKPAQEYLLRCALEEGSLPRINGPVDALNTASLASGLPISLLSLRKCSRRLLIRRGRPDEAYIFNSAGQVLDVEDLIVTCDDSGSASQPVGSPVKDSMAGKIESQDTSLVAIIYAPRDEAGQEAAMAASEHLSFGMCEFCDAVVGQRICATA